MKDLKFRYWDGENTMVDWGCMRQTAFNRGDSSLMYDLFTDHDDGVSMMQFTGLKDKNGVDIYEGDIIDDKFDCGQLMVVFYSDENAAFMVDHINHKPVGRNDTFKCCIAISPDTATKGIIIGNIYENPELLK